MVLAIDPHTPSTLYELDGAGGLFKSTDAGDTWGNTSLTAAATAFGAPAIDPLATGTLYVGTGGYGLFKSTDAGATWTVGLPSTRVDAVVIHPSTPSTLYAAAGGVLTSTDAGATWTATNAPLTSTLFIALAIAPTMPGTRCGQRRRTIPSPGPRSPAYSAPSTTSGSATC